MGTRSRLQQLVFRKSCLRELSRRLGAVGPGQDGDAYRDENSCVAVYVTLSSNGIPPAAGRSVPVVAKLCHPLCRTVVCSATAPLNVTLAEASDPPAGSKSSTTIEAPRGQGTSSPRNSAAIWVPWAAQTRPTAVPPSWAGAISRSAAPKNTWVVLRECSAGAAPGRRGKSRDSSDRSRTHCSER